jgi:hypothetical protein
MRPRLFRLLELHQRIDEALRRELRRHWPDPFKVSRLRQKKVRVKHRLTRLAPQLRSA